MHMRHRHERYDNSSGVDEQPRPRYAEVNDPQWILHGCEGSETDCPTETSRSGGRESRAHLDKQRNEHDSTVIDVKRIRDTRLEGEQDGNDRPPDSHP